MHAVKSLKNYRPDRAGQDQKILRTGGRSRGWPDPKKLEAQGNNQEGLDRALPFAETVATGFGEDLEGSVFRERACLVRTTAKCARSAAV